MSTCPHPECSVSVESTMFACRGHWYSLPKALRNEIWRNYHSGDVDRVLDGYEKARAHWNR